MRISRKRVSPPRIYNLNGFDLEVVESEKDLGVMIANDTSWKEHIVMIVAKANRMLDFLKRHCAGLVDSEALLHLYSSLVHSRLLLLASLGPSICCNSANSNRTGTEKSHTLYCW